MTVKALDDLTDLEEFYEEYQPLDLQWESSKIENQWITFQLEEEQYGLEILKIQELISCPEITHLPNMPTFFKGMINLRGLVVPVVDLRLKFGFPEKEYNKYTVIIIVKVDGKLMGTVVDSVSNVISLPDETIQPVDKFSTSIRTDYILGMGHHKSEMVILLDIEKILSKEEFELVLDSSATLFETAEEAMKRENR